MEITTKVVAHLDHKEGVSKSSGKEWSRDTFLFDNGNETNHQSFVADVWSKPLAEWLKANVGSDGMFLAVFSMEAREYNGRHYNTLRVYKVMQNGKDVTTLDVQQKRYLDDKAFDEILGMTTPPPPTQKEDEEDGQGELPF